MQDAETTRGITISVFCCMLVFDLFNAALSFRIWRPFGQKQNQVELDPAQNDAKVGLIFYMLSAIAYTIILTSCLYKRFFIEHIPLIQEQDWQTFSIVGLTTLALYAVAKTIYREPFFNSYFSGLIGFIVVLVPQVKSATHILGNGTQGVAEKALWIGLTMIFCKLAYYSYVNYQAEDTYKKSKAKGVLIAESGNLISWLFVLWAFYSTTQ